jgi:hypothetical protein
MPPPPATSDLYSLVQRYQLLLLFGGRRLWRGMTPDFDASWSRIVPSLVALTSGAQLAAARAGADYVPTVLEQTGQPDEPLAAVRPQAFAGVASDGRSLAGLLEGSVVAAKRAVARGVDGGDALAYGERWLEQALQSAVADASRDATQAAVAVRPRLQWVRVVNAPSCSRCAVLAGKVFNWNASFDRHPQCDCLALPVTVANADSFLTNPTELARRGLIKDLSRDQRDRLADGADLPKVLNESRDAWRERLAADRRRTKAEAKRQSWGPGGNEPPAGSTVHDLMARLTSQVEFARAARAVGIAA